MLFEQVEYIRQDAWYEVIHCTELLLCSFEDSYCKGRIVWQMLLLLSNSSKNVLRARLLHLQAGTEKLQQTGRPHQLGLLPFNLDSINSSRAFGAITFVGALQLMPLRFSRHPSSFIGAGCRATAGLSAALPWPVPKDLSFLCLLRALAASLPGL